MGAPMPGYIQLDGTNFVAQPSPPNKEFDQGQAVIACSLKGAAHLNGKRGVVQRRDPHPARKGRWEVELRVSDGKVEVVALKAENIMTLNKQDKLACRAWMKEEKRHKELNKKREEEHQRFQEAMVAKKKEDQKKEHEQKDVEQ